MQDFRNLTVSKKAHDLALAVYRATAAFPQSERFGLSEQMRRASVSIASNIAEGAGRGSDADFARFLHHATGSANELECQIALARDPGFINSDRAKELSDARREVKRMLVALLARLRQSSAHGRNR